MFDFTNLTANLQARLSEPLPLVQVLLGPRQVGKTTAAKELFDSFTGGKLMVSADGPIPPDYEWLKEQWFRARALPRPTLLIVDEVQKVDGWSEVVKLLFDEDRSTTDLRVLLLGSSSLYLQRGLSESLAGRFELLRAYHWNLGDMEHKFGFSVEQFLSYGGYPGAARFVSDSGSTDRWQSYMLNSVVEPVLGKDLALASSVSRPALLRQTFELAMSYPAQEVSYQKLLGQLQGRGAIDAVKHSLSQFEAAFLLRQVFRYSTRPLSTRTSSPKLLPLTPALPHAFADPRRLSVDSEWRGRIFEAAVGAALARSERELFFWRDGQNEVDFVIIRDGVPIAIEVKSGRRRAGNGISKFCSLFPKAEGMTLTYESALPLLRGTPI